MLLLAIDSSSRPKLFLRSLSLAWVAAKLDINPLINAIIH